MLPAEKGGGEVDFSELRSQDDTIGAGMGGASFPCAWVAGWEVIAVSTDKRHVA